MKEWLAVEALLAGLYRAKLGEGWTPTPHIVLQASMLEGASKVAQSPSLQNFFFFFFYAMNEQDMPIERSLQCNRQAFEDNTKINFFQRDLSHESSYVVSSVTKSPG